MIHILTITAVGRSDIAFADQLLQRTLESVVAWRIDERIDRWIDRRERTEKVKHVER